MSKTKTGIEAWHERNTLLECIADDDHLTTNQRVQALIALALRHQRDVGKSMRYLREAQDLIEADGIPRLD